MVIFSWLISANATQKVGLLNFLIRFSCVNDEGIVEYAWHTDIYKNIKISNGINNTDFIVTEYPDILEQWHKEFSDIAQGVDGVSPIVEFEETEYGVNVFVTDAEGIKSTMLKHGNDGTKGDKGDKGDAGYTPQKGIDYFDGQNGKDGQNGISVTHVWNGTNLSVTSASGTSSANLKGEQGNSGVVISETAPQAYSDGKHPLWLNPNGNMTLEIPNQLSQLTDDATHRTVTDAEKANWNSKLNQSDLQSGINTALAQAKASGEFDGAKGEQGIQGIQGIQGEKGADGAKGDKGDKGETGADGVSATHSWNGTTLTITSASGTSSADLKGAKGDKGEDGVIGKDGTSPTVSVSAITGGNRITITDVNGTKNVDVMNGTNGSNGSKGADGVSVQSVQQTTTSNADGGNNVVTVTLSNGQTATFNVKNGSKGSTGADGVKGADGKTPVRGTDYWTSADIAEIKGYVDSAILGGAW